MYTVSTYYCLLHEYVSQAVILPSPLYHYIILKKITVEFWNVYITIIAQIMILPLYWYILYICSCLSRVISDLAFWHEMYFQHQTWPCNNLSTLFFHKISNWTLSQIECIYYYTIYLSFVMLIFKLTNSQIF